ncbi:MAG TPA: hypothetical protein VF823_01925, partial [Anaerolineales bacterium]
VVNKADRPGVESTERALRGMLGLAHPGSRAFQDHSHAIRSAVVAEATGSTWIPPIQRTVATEGTGIEQLAQHIARHQAYLVQSGNWKHREQVRLESELHNLLQAELVDRWQKAVPPEQYKFVLQALFERKISPHQAVEELLNGDVRS